MKTSEHFQRLNPVISDLEEYAREMRTTADKIRRLYVTMDERDEESEYIMRLTCWLEWIAESCWFNIRDLKHYVSHHG